MKTIVVISLLFCTISAFATNMEKPKTNIVGNPIARQDDYTINADKPQWIDVKCTFTNSGAQPAELQVWVTPNAAKPMKAVHLKPASNTTPYQVSDQFHLQLKKHWWCRIYTPQQQKHKWHYCTYFSIADATIAEYKPFGNFDKTVHSKNTSYHCHIKKPTGKISFFYFK